MRRRPSHRRNAPLAPLWDGNETWLVAVGTMLLAAVLPGYYVLLPAFYVAVVTMLFSLILRGAAFEFRFAGSLLAALSQGFILGGFIQGVPVRDGIFAGGTFDFLSPLGLLCGLGLVGGYGLLGAGWLIWKTSGPTQVFGREIGRAALIATMAMMAVVSLWTALTQPVILQRWFDGSFLFAQALLPIVAVAAAVVLWQNLWGQQEALPFFLGLVLFLCGFGGLAVSLWPYVVPRQITIWQAAGDLQSLRILGVGTVVILPIILAYLAHSYWTFRGKIVDGEAGYGASNPNPALARRRTSALKNDLHLS